MHFFLIVFLCKMHRAHHTLRPPCNVQIPPGSNWRHFASTLPYVVGPGINCTLTATGVHVGLCVCVTKGEFTSKSDVWSFAVTLWEILTLARRRPFDSLSDDEVCRRHAAAAGAVQGSPSTLPALTLDQPGNCPREIYDLMVECWRVEARRRPTFHEMHMFLQRKNSGYSLDDEPLPLRSHQQTISDV